MTSSDWLAVGSIVLTSALGLIGFLVRTLYQKDSEGQKEAIKELKAEIEGLKRQDGELSTRIHMQEKEFARIIVKLDNIDEKLDVLMNKKVSNAKAL